MAEISLAGEPVFHLGSWGVPNSVVTTWLVMLVFFVGVFFLRRKKLRSVPKGFQNFVEAIIEFLLNGMKNIVGVHKAYRFFPVVATLFLFIIMSNWFGLFPGVGSIGFYGEHDGKELFIPFLRSANSDLNTTLALALIAVTTVHLFGILTLGFKSHVSKYVMNPIKHNIMSAVGILELFGEVSRIISFSFRLFGNIFAGEVLLIVITGLVAFGAPVPFYFLELFVGFVQALVFAMLTLVFLTLATEEHH